MLRHWYGSVLAAIAALALTGPAAQARSLEEIISSGTLKVGTYADQPPLSSLNDAGGYEGFDVDVATLLAKQMGVTLEIVPLTPDQRVPFLTSGRIDMSMGALTRTPARALLVDFTIPLHSEAVAVLTREDVAINIWKDLDAADFTIAQGRGTWTADMVAAELPAANKVMVTSGADQVAAVAQGRADAIVDVIDTFMVFTKNYPDVKFKVMDAGIYNAWCAIGVPKGDSGMVNFLNVFLYDLHSSGKTQEIWAKWYGAPNPTPVPVQPVF
jgi:polar amino acid transport system substrate-binding protein